MTRVTLACLGLALLLGACKKAVPPPLYQAIAVARRDIIVSAEAAGTIEPILIVDVKSRASGTILEMRAQTGQLVSRGDSLVLVDKRDPTNTFNQATADLEVARAQLNNAESQKRRTDAMFQGALVSEQEHEAANLTYANARAQLVRAQTAVQTARDALDDTDIRAPITGTIIAKNVEVGNVIASATRDVTGGVVLLKMADLTTVQVRTLVDETDIGKIQPGLVATITVDAYPNRPFQGTVLKIEPQSTTNQNVTMFPVLIRIANEETLLKPGMNCQVQIQVAQRPGVLAIPNAALRTQRDVASAATVLGLDPQQVFKTLAQADSQAVRAGGPGGASADARTGAPAPLAAAPETAGSMGGRTLPSGAPVGRGPGGMRGAPGGEGSAPGGGAGRGMGGGQSGMGAGQGAMRASPAGMSGGPGGFGSGTGGGRGNNRFGGAFIVFVQRDGHPTPARIRTGVTDLDYTEVTGGLTEKDTVLMLPSASLLQSQQEMRDRMQRMTGGGVPGMKQQAPARTTPAGTAPSGGPGGRSGMGGGPRPGGGPP
jgi:HlyD family secretion protein